jgi:hypothetical protein
MRGRGIAQLAGLVALLSACAAPSSSATDALPSPTALASRLATATAEPVAESAEDLLDCDGPPSPMGGFADDFGPDGIGDSPDEAFRSFLEVGFFEIPRSGYEYLGAVGTRHVYTYEADGHTKVVVVISGRFSELVGGAPFTIEELRTCDPSEYGGSVDLGPDRRVWTHETTGEILTDLAGPGHCGWQSARMLHISTPDGLSAKQYVRDPDNVFEGRGFLAGYAEDVDLPDDATFSGYRTDDGLELWFTPDDVAAYVVTADGVERWPRVDPPAGCV